MADQPFLQPSTQPSKLSVSSATETQKSLRGKIAVLEKEVVGRTLGYIVGAFGLVAALAWNEFVQALFMHIFPTEQESVFAKLVYALVATLIALAVILGFSQWAKKM